MIKKRGWVLIPILTLIFSFGFIAQPTNADTSTTTTTEGTAQTTDQTATTEDTTQTTDQTVDNTTSTTQSTDQTKQTTQTAVQSTDEVVAFKDANLAQAIRSQLQLKQGEDITKTDMEKVNYLFTKDISNLSGLEYAKNLVMLGISGGSISDLSPLSNLTKLQSISLSGNQIIDLSPLKSLTNLQSLNLSGNKVTDISALTKLPNLKKVLLDNNPLNLNPGSAAYEYLQALVGNGVQVYHDGMVHFTTKKVTKDAITVEWTIDKSDGMPHLFTLSLNGKPVKKINMVKKAESEYTFTGLKEGQEYNIDLSMYFNLTERDTKVTKTLQVKAEDIQPQQQVTVTPAVGGNTATIGNLNGDAIKENGTLAIDLKNYKEDQVNVNLTVAQIKTLQDKKASVKINRGDSTVSIPAQLLGSGKDVTVEVDKLKPVQGALSAAYDFTIKTATGTISKFKQPVTLTFTVDPSKVTNPDNVKVWYYNTSTKKWELIGGTYSNGIVTAQTYHFSTYTVFEKDQKSSSSTTGSSSNSGSSSKANAGSGTTTNSDSGTNDELPNTATNTMNFMVFGALLVLLAAVILWLQKRKQKA